MPKDATLKKNALTELIHEKELLSQQVKGLIRAEGLLYSYQEELDAQLTEYKDLYDLSKKILATTDVKTILEHAVEYATQKLQYERAIFFVVCEPMGSFEVCAVDGFYDHTEKAEVSSLLLDRDDPLLASLIQTEDHVACLGDDCRKSLQACRRRLHMHEFLLYALGPPESPLAILAVGNSTPNPDFYRTVSVEPASLVGLGNFVSLISSHVENTILRVKMEKIREQEMLTEKKYRDIFENSLDGIFRRTPDGSLLDANPALARMLGYDSPGELMSEAPRIAQLYVKRKRMEEMAEQIEKQGFLNAFETEMYRRDKSVIWVSITARAARDDLGLISFHEGIIEDITERKKAEEALRQSEQKYRRLTENLEQRVAQTVDELRKKDEMLIVQGRLALMGELLNNIAHQWRQPLNMLALLAQEVQMYYRLGRCDEQYIGLTTRKEMEIIEHMSQTIDAFRDFFKPDKEKTAFRVLENVQQTLSLLEGMLKGGEIEVKLYCADANVEINGYPNQFSQVMINLLNNARDAFERQKVRARRIEIRLGREQGKIVIRVADNAGGIPEAILEKIFEPYFTTKGPQQGTGIGLFMSKTIIEKHMQGVLQVRNLKKGAEFIIKL